MHVSPLIVWVAVQLAALALAAGRVPLAARYPAPAELEALTVMLATQVTAAAVLFPFLMRGGATAVAVVAATLPFTALAGALAAAALGELVQRALPAVLWLTLLGLAYPLVGPGHRPVLHATAVAWALFPPLLNYLNAEFAAATDGAWAVGPLDAVMQTTPPTGFAVTLGGLILVTLLAYRFRRHAARGEP